MKKDMQQALLAWYDTSHRVLPWRENVTPYRVWISEIMLQQTRVEAVKAYYIRFMEALPTLKDLATIEENALMKLWEGLGYYSRARNLQRAASYCMEQCNGQLPSTYEELLLLPGIGEYTAGAIASIAYNQAVPAVDGNVLRVYSRLDDDGQDIMQEKTKKAYRKRIAREMPAERAGDFNQALMELGATICTPHATAQCIRCPLQYGCMAYKAGTVQERPVKAKKKARRIEQHTILLVQYQDRYVLQKRRQSGLLANLYEFINLAGSANQVKVLEDAKAQGWQIQSVENLPDSKHIFTHIEWHMQAFLLMLHAPLTLDTDTVWASKEDMLHTYSIPSAFQAYKDWIFSHR